VSCATGTFNGRSPGRLARHCARRSRQRPDGRDENLAFFYKDLAEQVQRLMQAEPEAAKLPS
jgi:hypothetical protein